ncbi:hypothetical protein VCUG_01749 [Vavraia culicis subsp. floridensis]|uniref:Uncharacterized protein n=1 Tax=Vavraia culicis (isolate floridensis) TaxID=948595 RepID=L2GUL2_VAVCU|nr:uncharacterized protein VCUG_01749 [Vavraia culicis subsp. floridensis]ELA46790.2 hypothetical protein VCUG_01749 [Vavraia culicis subsp. floridensis]
MSNKLKQQMAHKLKKPTKMSNCAENLLLITRKDKKSMQEIDETFSATIKDGTVKLNNISYYEISSEGMNKSNKCGYIKRLESPENYLGTGTTDSFNWSEYDQYLQDGTEQPFSGSDNLVAHAELFIDCMKKMEREREY